MTTTDEAVLWAQKTAAPHHGYNRTMDRAEAYRAGQQSADERVKVLEAENERLRHIAADTVQHLEWLTSGLPDILEAGGLTDEGGVIGAAIDAAKSARAALGDA